MSHEQRRGRHQGGDGGGGERAGQPPRRPVNEGEQRGGAQEVEELELERAGDAAEGEVAPGGGEAEGVVGGGRPGDPLGKPGEGKVTVGVGEAARLEAPDGEVVPTPQRHPRHLPGEEGEGEAGGEERQALAPRRWSGLKRRRLGDRPPSAPEEVDGAESDGEEDDGQRADRQPGQPGERKRGGEQGEAEGEGERRFAKNSAQPPGGAEGGHADEQRE